MNCPCCNEQTREPLTCAQCGSTFCARCNPHWDYTGEICQVCQEHNSIAAIKDEVWTGRLRRWFTKKLPSPEQPTVGLPWSVEAGLDDNEWMLVAGGKCIAMFENKGCAEHACAAANAHYELAGLAVKIHNRIREGDVYWNGGKEDCELWSSIRKLLCPPK